MRGQRERRFFPAAPVVASVNDEPDGLGLRGLKALGDVLPVGDVPSDFDVARPDVEIVEIEGALSHVQYEQWNGSRGDIGLPVEELEDSEFFGG